MSSISALSSASNPYQQMRQLFQTMGSDLQSGQLSGAQTAYTQLQQLQQQLGGPNGASSAGPSSVVTIGSSGAASPKSLMATLGSELQSGNLSAAQSTYSSLASSFSSHHAHHGMGGGMGSSLSSLLSATSGSSGSSGSINSLLAGTSSMSSVTSGSSASGMQAILQSILQEIQGSTSTSMNLTA